jgi:hypothetical protein
MSRRWRGSSRAVRPGAKGRINQRKTGSTYQVAEWHNLETGIYQREAIGPYERQGFYRIPPFGSYTDDPVSLCYEKRLT